MTASAPFSRRSISRELSRIADASVSDVLGMTRASEGTCRRIGVTGPPGAGKSSLIARLVRQRLERLGPIAVVAVDPTSPVSGGAILGDRIRMEELATDPRVFIRSLASRVSRDGLADNLPDILGVFERAGFVELIVETVGVGQVEYEVRRLVDTTLLVLMPGAGDQVQAMKGGILEAADILVVNKSDQPGARQLAGDLAGVMKVRREDPAGWKQPIVSTSLSEPESFAKLSHEIDRHQAWMADTGGLDARLAERRMHHVGSLLSRRIGEVMSELTRSTLQGPIPDLYDAVVERLASGATREGGRDRNPN